MLAWGVLLTGDPPPHAASSGPTTSTLLLPPASCPAPLQLDPGNVHALFNRGISHEKRGDQRAAIADFSACISLDPGNAVAYYNRAACYDAVGEFDKASGRAAAVRVHAAYGRPC